MHLVPLPLILFLGTSQESLAQGFFSPKPHQSAVTPLSLSQAAQSCCSDCSSPVLQPLITSTASSWLTPTCLEPKTSQGRRKPCRRNGAKG